MGTHLCGNTFLFEVEAFKTIIYERTRVFLNGVTLQTWNSPISLNFSTSKGLL